MRWDQSLADPEPLSQIERLGLYLIVVGLVTCVYLLITWRRP